MGEFDEAERLIRSKGTIEERLTALQERQEVLRQLEEATRQVIKANEKDIQSLKRDLSLLIDIADAHLRPDSAYFYSKQLAEVDPEDAENIESIADLAWGFENGKEKVLTYFDQALSIYQKRNDTLNISRIWKRLGMCLNYYEYRIVDGDTLYNYSYFYKSANILRSYFKGDNVQTREALFHLGMSYFFIDSLKSKLYFNEVKAYDERVLSNDSTDIMALYNLCEISHWINRNREEYNACMFDILGKAMLDQNKNHLIIKDILEMMTASGPNWFPFDEVLRLKMEFYPQHMYTYQDTLDFVINIPYHMQSSPSSPLADSACNMAIYMLEQSKNPRYWEPLGNLYVAKEDYSAAKKCFELELQNTIKIYGEKSKKTGEFYARIVPVYEHLKEFEKAIYCNYQTIDILDPTSEYDSYEILDAYSSLGRVAYTSK